MNKMTKEELEKILFGEQTLVYAILDGASVPDLRMKLYKMHPPHYCLFRGELEPDMAEVAPYVIQLIANAPFTDWVLSESFGKHWGIFAQCRHSIKEMRRHFRAIVTVYKEDGEPMIFRFYDPRVLRKFLPTCNNDELKALFGKVETFFAEDEKEQPFSAFRLENDKLKQTDLN
ncbi:MAG: DUF4123 domain-containing protein [Actinomycetota bacterium]